MTTKLSIASYISNNLKTILEEDESVVDEEGSDCEVDADDFNGGVEDMAE